MKTLLGLVESERMNIFDFITCIKGGSKQSPEGESLSLQKMVACEMSRDSLRDRDEVHCRNLS